MSSLIDERGHNQGYAPTPAQRRRLARRAEAMLDAMGAAGGGAARILELGCGTGELAHHLSRAAGADVLGLDRSPRFIAEAARTHGSAHVGFRVADITRDLPGFEAESFDFIVGNGVLHHVPGEFDRVLPELKRLLKPGGKLIFWEPNYLNPFVYFIFTLPWLRRRARLEPGEMAFTARRIRRRLQAAGMSRTEVRVRDFLLPTTPARLIGAVTLLGVGLERIPGVRSWAQSLFIVSTK